MRDARRILAAGACRRPVDRSHIHSVVGMAVGVGEVIEAVGRWTRVGGRGGGLESMSMEW